MEPLNADADLGRAVALHQAGQTRQAEQIYRHILQANPANADAWHLLGVIALQERRGDEAIDCIRRAIALAPAVPMMHSNLGVAFKIQQRWDEAIASYRQALAMQPNYPDAQYNLGRVLQEQGCRDEAVAAYRQALELKPAYTDALNSLGQVLREQGRFEEAATVLQQALQVQPTFVEAQVNLGNVLRDQKKLTEAMACYEQALRQRPDLAEAHNNLACLFQEHKRFDDAVRHLRSALRIKPDYLEAHNNLGLALLSMEQHEESEACFRGALRIKPDSAEAHHGLGKLMHAQNNFDEAIASYQRALELEPRLAAARHDLGCVFQAHGNLAQAEACYAQALSVDGLLAETHFSRAYIWLQRGDFERGWTEYEWRWKLPRIAPRNFPRPLWDGVSFAGKVLLLHAEQGMGDTLQFIRYVPLAKMRGGTVVVACHKPLMTLLARFPGIDQLYSLTDPLPNFDVHAPLLSLPGIFKTSLETIPAQVPYLFADEQLSAHWQRRLSSLRGFKIGIAWQGNRGYMGDRSRSIPLAQFAALGRLNGISLVSLQKGPGSEHLRTLPEGLSIWDLSSELDETSGPFMDTAAVMKNLDLVITSDTSIAHLAGALGVPVWVALSASPDWRWLLNREDSPWYPSMRLFRQKKLDDWPEVFERIAEELKARVERGSLERDRTDRSDDGALRAPALCTPVLDMEQAVQLHRAGDLRRAQQIYRQILDFNSAHVDALYFLGVIALQERRFDQAAECFTQALAHRPDFAEAHEGLGCAWYFPDKLERAIGHHRRALELKPDYIEARHNLAIALRAQGSLDEAEKCLDEILQRKPEMAEAHFVRASIWLLKGDFERGWPEYEWRWRQAAVQQPRFSQPPWDGSPFPGKVVLLHTEQGLGDTLQFIRYSPLVKERSGTVVVACQRSLMKLLQPSPGIDLLVPLTVPLPAFDYQASLLSLPGLFKTTLENIPTQVPYLFADQRLCDLWRRRLSDLSGFKIGIAWQGDPAFASDPFRSIPLAQFAPLGRAGGINLISLQKGPGTEQLRDAPECLNIWDRGTSLDEAAGPFMDTAAIMKNLDLVITSDTAIAHLAGGLGVPVWVALAFSPEWRWLLGRDDSPWYPSMRLFRQRQLGDWQEVFERMAQELERLKIEDRGSKIEDRSSIPDPQSSITAAVPRPCPRATICILTYGEYLAFFRRCFDSILANTPLQEIELRLGFNNAPHSFAYARERLGGGTDPVEKMVLSGEVERLSFLGPGGMRVRMWNSPTNLYKEPMARLLYHDLPLETEYAVWFDDDSFVEAGWWPALNAVLDRKIDYIGQPWWVDYLPGQVEMIQAQLWYRGVPFEARNNQFAGVHFMTGGFVAVRSERIYQANFPDTDFTWKSDTLQQYGGDTLLGEIARQLGWTRQAHDAHIKVNVDMHGRHPAPRRGGTGRQFGSDIDVVM